MVSDNERDLRLQVEVVRCSGVKCSVLSLAIRCGVMLVLEIRHRETSSVSEDAARCSGSIVSGALSAAHRRIAKSSIATRSRVASYTMGLIAWPAGCSSAAYCLVSHLPEWQFLYTRRPHVLHRRPPNGRSLAVACMPPPRSGMAPLFPAACITEPLSGRPFIAIHRNRSASSLASATTAIGVRSVS